MRRRVHAVAQTLLAVALAVIVEPLATAHHGADPAAETPLWQIAAIGIFVLILFGAIRLAKKYLMKREHRTTALPPGT